MKSLQWIFIIAVFVNYIAFFISGLKEYDFLIAGTLFLILLDVQDIKAKLYATQTN